MKLNLSAFRDAVAALWLRREYARTYELPDTRFYVCVFPNGTFWPGFIGPKPMRPAGAASLPELLS